MNTKDPKLIALLFNECINRRNVDGLAAFMTDDHTFVDNTGASHGPKEQMVSDWREFFQAFPCYRNTISRVESRGDLVVAVGFAYWSDTNPHDSAIWTALVENDLVREWRVFVDTEANRRILDLS